MAPSMLNKILKNIYDPGYAPLDMSEKLQEMKDVFDSCKHGSNTSIILIGPRGCGKSYLFNKLRTEHQDSILIYLNGHVHFDDNVAMQAIVTRLNISLDLSDQENHTLSENFEYLASVLQESRYHDQTVLFVLDHFELFALRPKQTMLYNLFDLLQRSNEVSMFLVGMTERKDVFDLLEKRVKSRFTHQKILLLGISEFDKVMNLYSGKLHLRKKGKGKAKWQRSVNAVLEDSEVKEQLKRQTMMQRTIGWFLAVLGDAVRYTDPCSPVFSKEALLDALKNRGQSTLWHAIEGMTVTELMILILVVKLELREDPLPFTCSKLMNLLTLVKEKVDIGVAFHVCDDRSIIKILHNFSTIGLILPVSTSGKVTRKESS